MSVIVKGMEMPKEGTVIAIYKLDGKFYASLHGTELCPIAPLPEKHGRLIDADALESTVDDRYTFGEIGRRERDDIVNALRYNAPTIAEAEGDQWK